jgi:hypothetical protein
MRARIKRGKAGVHQGGCCRSNPARMVGANKVDDSSRDTQTHRQSPQDGRRLLYQTLAGLGAKGSARLEGAPTTQQQQHQSHQQQDQQQMQQQQQNQQFAQQQPAHHVSRNEARRQQHQLNLTQQVSSAVNTALAALQQTHVQQQIKVPLRQHTEAGVAIVSAMSQQTQLALPPFPGLDARGINRHIHSPLLECRCIPCLGKFCQACGIHGLTVENCRKRLFHNPAANKSGH